jgi:hypothetical protein
MMSKKQEAVHLYSANAENVNPKLLNLGSRDFFVGQQDSKKYSTIESLNNSSFESFGKMKADSEFQSFAILDKFDNNDPFNKVLLLISSFGRLLKGLFRKHLVLLLLVQRH